MNYEENHMVERFQRDQLTICIYEDKKTLGKATADLGEKLIGEAIDQRGEAVIILATGVSQFEFLESFITRKINWSHVISFHLDEYVGIPEQHPASFRKYLHDRVLDHVKMKQYYLIQGDQGNPRDECRRMSRIFNRYPVDVAFIGIGENGHIAFNDPPAKFDDTVSYKMVKLDETSRRQQFKEGWFKSISDVPTHAITMTVPAIMRSNTILCTVPDLRKANAVKNTLCSEITPAVPASILRQHHHATLLLDVSAASLWKNQ